jgi:hypothetical protein
MFNSNLLTADPKEHLLRARILLNQKNDSFLLYSALEMRLAIERIVHNQLTLSDQHSRGTKNKNDPKRKKLVMGIIDPESNDDYDIFYTDPDSGDRVFWGTYKNIPENRIKTIEGRLGNLLHMKLGLRLGVPEDPWYADTREFLDNTCDYLIERITDSKYFFSYQGLENFELIKK